MHTFSIDFEGHSVKVRSNPRLKHSYITIDRDNNISIKTANTKKSYLYSLLEEKSSWIQKRLLKNAQHKPIEINLEDELLLFGEVCSIDTPQAAPLRKKIEKIALNDREKIEKAYNQFYKEIAKEYLTQELLLYAQEMNLRFSEVKFRKMRSRWGSCSSRGVITLNSELIKLEKELIAYVLVHELAHLVHMNHSKAFHALVEHYLPNAKSLRKRLKESRVLG